MEWSEFSFETIFTKVLYVVVRQQNEEIAIIKCNWKLFEIMAYFKRGVNY